MTVRNNKVLEVAEMKYQRLNSFYDGASLPVKMLFMLAIGVVLVGTFSVILPPIYKMAQEFGEYVYHILNM